MSPENIPRDSSEDPEPQKEPVSESTNKKKSHRPFVGRKGKLVGAGLALGAAALGASALLSRGEKKEDVPKKPDTVEKINRLGIEKEKGFDFTGLANSIIVLEGELPFRVEDDEKKMREKLERFFKNPPKNLKVNPHDWLVKKISDIREQVFLFNRMIPDDDVTPASIRAMYDGHRRFISPYLEYVRRLQRVVPEENVQ